MCATPQLAPRAPPATRLWLPSLLLARAMLLRCFCVCFQTAQHACAHPLPSTSGTPFLGPLFVRQRPGGVQVRPLHLSLRLQIRWDLRFRIGPGARPPEPFSSVSYAADGAGRASERESRCPTPATPKLFFLQETKAYQAVMALKARQQQKKELAAAEEGRQAAVSLEARGRPPAKLSPCLQHFQFPPPPLCFLPAVPSFVCSALCCYYESPCGSLETARSVYLR